ncbi:MAG TPA: hypothetical protein VN329_14680 [Roseomonas sp.]|nr:hypothetical protein [Roseomonas sp.]
MTAPPPGRNDETVRILASELAPHPPPPSQGQWARRLLVVGGGGLLLAGAAAALLWPDDDRPAGPQRLGPPRLMPPLLRTSLRGEGVVYALLRRAEQDEADPPGTPAPRERIELHAFAAAGLVPRFVVHLASVPRGAMPDAGLIAEQGATIWVWLNGLGAVSAVDGQVLADTEGLAAINPPLAEALNAAARRSYRLADGLVLEGGPAPHAWRFDPRDFRASAAGLPPPRPLPQLNPGAAHGPGGPTAFRVAEARIGDDWLGLPAADVKLAAPVAPRAQGRFLPTAAPPTGMLQQLWRGAVRLGSAAPPNWPANLPNRWGQAERLVDVATVPGVAGLALAGFLTSGTEAELELAGPPGALILHGEGGQPLGLIRVASDGAVAWRAALPVSRLRSVLPGPRSLVLAGWAGAGEDAAERLVAIELEGGAVQSRPLSA